MDTGDLFRRLQAVEERLEKLEGAIRDQVSFNHEINGQLNAVTAAHNEVAKIISVAAGNIGKKKIVTLN